jgi:dihydrofolate reductase
MKFVLIAVVSLDGRITRPGQAGAGFASPEDQAWFKRALGEFDCSVMGRRTYATIRDDVLAAPEDARLRMVLTRDPRSHEADTRAGRLEFTQAHPVDLAKHLERRGRKRCALLGGGEVYRQFLDAGLVDALWLTLEPVLFGAGVRLVDGAIAEKKFELAETRALSRDTLLLNYSRPKAPPVPLPPSAP